MPRSPSKFTSPTGQRKMAVVWFPRFETTTFDVTNKPATAKSHMHSIEQFRLQHDPAAKVPAHVFLVFPFYSAFTPLQLGAHVRRVVRNWPVIPATFRHPELLLDEYVLLPAQRGQAAICQLHDALYTGVLSPYLRREMSYHAHLTLGRVAAPPSRISQVHLSAQDHQLRRDKAQQVLARAELHLREEYAAVLRTLNIVEYAPDSIGRAALDTITHSTSVPMNWS